MATNPILIGICAKCGRYFDGGVLVFHPDREHGVFYCVDHVPDGDGTTAAFSGHDAESAE